MMTAKKGRQQKTMMTDNNDNIVDMPKRSTSKVGKKHELLAKPKRPKSACELRGRLIAIVHALFGDTPAVNWLSQAFLSTVEALSTVQAKTTTGNLWLALSRWRQELAQIAIRSMIAKEIRAMLSPIVASGLLTTAERTSILASNE